MKNYLIENSELKYMRFCPKALHLIYLHHDADLEPWSPYVKDDDSSHFLIFMSLLHIFMVTLATVITSFAFCFLRSTQIALAKTDVPKWYIPSGEEPVSYFHNDYDDNGPATSTTEENDVQLTISKSFLHEHTYEDVV